MNSRLFDIEIPIVVNVLRRHLEIVEKSCFMPGFGELSLVMLSHLSLTINMDLGYIDLSALNRKEACFINSAKNLPKTGRNAEALYLNINPDAVNILGLDGSVDIDCIDRPCCYYLEDNSIDSQVSLQGCFPIRNYREFSLQDMLHFTPNAHLLGVLNDVILERKWRGVASDHFSSANLIDMFETDNFVVGIFSYEHMGAEHVQLVSVSKISKLKKQSSIATTVGSDRICLIPPIRTTSECFGLLIYTDPYILAYQCSTLQPIPKYNTVLRITDALFGAAFHCEEKGVFIHPLFAHILRAKNDEILAKQSNKLILRGIQTVVCDNVSVNVQRFNNCWGLSVVIAVSYEDTSRTILIVFTSGNYYITEHSYTSNCPVRLDENTRPYLYGVHTAYTAGVFTEYNYKYIE
jgi:hypothetical protein